MRITKKLASEYIKASKELIAHYKKHDELMDRCPFCRIIMGLEEFLIINDPCAYCPWEIWGWKRSGYAENDCSGIPRASTQKQNIKRLESWVEKLKKI